MTDTDQPPTKPEQAGSPAVPGSRLLLQDGRTVKLHIHLCADKHHAQAVVKAHIGYLPSDLTDCFWMSDGEINIAIRRDSSPGRIAHEAFHAAAAMVESPNDYNLMRPNGGDFGFIPAEVAADLCEQIVDAIHAANASDVATKPAPVGSEKHE